MHQHKSFGLSGSQFEHKHTVGDISVRTKIILKPIGNLMGFSYWQINLPAEVEKGEIKESSL